ncbi:C1 family peptidase [Sorangium sp. So ce1014]|uniref:C1 family peptidase n=1 Tax=Sorangium sp. So ce1014 TaxID=3133326 RepID=UPI003F6266A3
MTITIDADLRDRLAEARDQGQRPTCLVFAVSAAHEAKRGSSDYLSPEFLFYSGVQRSHNDPKKGLTRSVVRDALIHDGQPPEIVWPYAVKTPDASNWKPPAVTVPTHKATIAFAQRDVVQVRELIQTGTPVLLIVTLTVAMYTPDKDAIVRARAGDTVTTRRHALLAVGSGHSGDGQYMLVRNSWGTTWGQAGHGWLHDLYLTPQLEMTGVIT